MSLIALQGGATGTGTVTLLAPVTSTNRTLTLPDQTATVITDSAEILNIGTGQIYKDASGNVGIGTSTPAMPLNVVGSATYSGLGNAAAIFQATKNTSSDGGVMIGAITGNTPYIAATKLNGGTGAATPLTFITNSTEAARIDSSGNLLVGTTSAVSSSNTFLVNSAKNALVIANGATADSTVLLSCIKSGSTSSTSQRYIGFSYNGGSNGNGAIAGNGDSQATFITLSDERLKENITDLPSQLNNVMALRPVEFDYKATGGHQIGFIAQEVQDIYSDLVAEGDDGYLTLAGFDKNIARLVKAIQELKAIVDAQGAEIAALKGNK